MNGRFGYMKFCMIECGFALVNESTTLVLCFNRPTEYCNTMYFATPVRNNPGLNKFDRNLFL